MWRGSELQSPADYIAAMAELETPADGQAFRDAYEAARHPAIDENLGYLTGYMSRAERTRVCALLGVEHPIFGTQEDWTVGDLLLLGMESQRIQMEHPGLPLAEAGARARATVKILRAAHGCADHEEDV